MSLVKKIARKMNAVSIGALSDVDPRDWARKPKSQAAVDLAIAGQMFEELSAARQAGYVVGNKWVPPHQRKKDDDD